MFRWDYDYVEIGEDPAMEKGYSLADSNELSTDADDWSLGSSSSVSPGSHSPVDGSNSWERETSHSDTEAQ